MIYTFEIVKYSGRRPQISYIWAISTEAACKIFDSKHNGFFDGVNVFLEGVLITHKEVTCRGCWSY